MKQSSPSTNRQFRPDVPPTPPATRFADVRGVADICDISVASVWRGVAAGTIPQPVYPAPRAPRWAIDELLAALNATRAKPGTPMHRRRAQRIDAAA